MNQQQQAPQPQQLHLIKTLNKPLANNASANNNNKNNQQRDADQYQERSVMVDSSSDEKKPQNYLDLLRKKKRELEKKHYTERSPRQVNSFPSLPQSYSFDECDDDDDDADDDDHVEERKEYHSNPPVSSPSSISMSSVKGQRSSSSLSFSYEKPSTHPNLPKTVAAATAAAAAPLRQATPRLSSAALRPHIWDDEQELSASRIKLFWR